MGNLLKSWLDKRAGGPFLAGAALSHTFSRSVIGAVALSPLHSLPLVKNLRIIKLPNGPDGRQFVQPS